MFAEFPNNTLGLSANPVALNSDGSPDETQLVSLAVGNQALGNGGGKWILCSFVGDGNTYFQGTAFSYDLDYVAAVLAATPGATDTTQTNLGVGVLFLGVKAKETEANVIVSQNNAGFTFVSGTTYNVWLQIEGQAFLAFDGKPVALTFTSATAGVLGHATATKAYTIQGIRSNKGTITFTANGVSGAFYLTVASGTNYDDIIFPGVALSGTGVGSSALVVAVWGSKSLGYTIQVSVANSATVSSATITPATLYSGLLNDPLIVSQAS